MKLKGWMILAGGLLSIGAGCSSSDEKCNTIGCGDDRNNTGGIGGGGGGEGGFVFGTGGTTSAGATTGTGGGVVSECKGVALDPETLPVDILIMFDQSDSMKEPVPPPGSGRWWDTAAQAVGTFVNSPEATSSGIGLGIHYFPLGGVEPASCNQALYTTPEVPVADLPGNAAAVTQSVAKHGPTTFTPTAPALAGAIAHMKSVARPGRAPIVVLVTDGFPTECEPRDPSDIAEIARAGFETEPKVRTFLVGFALGAGKENLNVIAKAGGTDKAFFIDNGDVGKQFVEAMLSITAAPLQCSFDIPKPPEGMTLDLKQIAVDFTPNLPPQIAEPLPFLQQPGDCVINNNKGFYYDNPNTPRQIMLCPGTCSKLAQGVLQTKLGCRPPPGQTM